MRVVGLLQERVQADVLSHELAVDLREVVVRTRQADHA